LDTKTARIVARTSFKSSSLLASIVPILSESCSPDESKRLGRAVAAVMAEINLSILRPVLDEHPEIEREIDESISQHGRLVE
jgi:hypothetical protein